jgi:UDP-N-acetylglucosamine 2-epimerase (non-hydrolysing)
MYMRDGKMIFLVAGARPNFMKLAPVARALGEQSINYRIIHTGQHYDYNLSKIFFEDLQIPKPDFFLEVGSASHAVQTAQVMTAFEQLCLENKPSLVIVFGDVNSTLACSLVSSKLRIKVAHVEAGLRSGDRNMPEEINRIVTDHVSDIHFTTSELASQNLIDEGISNKNIHFVGNVMIDTLMWQMNKIDESRILEKLNLESRKYELLTLHRPSNVDNKVKLMEILEAFNSNLFDKIVFPIHPRTKNSISKFDLGHLLDDDKFVIIDPLGYNDFLSLVKNSKAVWTDSGGIQEETTFLGVRCITLRENTERPETVEIGTNMLLKPSLKSILEVKKELSDVKYEKIPLWDGKTSQRIIKYL